MPTPKKSAYTVGVPFLPLRYHDSIEGSPISKATVLPRFPKNNRTSPWTFRNSNSWMGFSSPPQVFELPLIEGTEIGFARGILWKTQPQSFLATMVSTTFRAVNDWLWRRYKTYREGRDYWGQRPCLAFNTSFALVLGYGTPIYPRIQAILRTPQWNTVLPGLVISWLRKGSKELRFLYGQCWKQHRWLISGGRPCLSRDGYQQSHPKQFDSLLRGTQCVRLMRWSELAKFMPVCLDVLSTVYSPTLRGRCPRAW